MKIEKSFQDNDLIPDRLAHGRLPSRWGFDNDHLGTLMPFGAPSTLYPYRAVLGMLAAGRAK